MPACQAVFSNTLEKNGSSPVRQQSQKIDDADDAIGVEIGRARAGRRTGAPRSQEHEKVTAAYRVVNISAPPVGFVPFIWQNGVMSSLEDLIVDPLANPSLTLAMNEFGQVVLSGSYGGEQAALLLTPANQPLGDIDHDCTVGINDFLALLAAWGPCPPTGSCPADLDRDGIVGIVDFLLLLANWTP